MLAVRKILYPTDFSDCARAALDHALFLAERHRCELHMLHAVVLHDHDPESPSHRFPQPAQIFEHLFRIADSELAQLAGDHGASDFRLVQARRRGFSVAEVVLDYAGEHDVDLVVMGTHGRRGPSRLLLGSVAERVVRRSRCPVLTLRERSEPPPLEAIQRLLVPVDFSDASRLALRHAGELATTYDAVLDLLHVVEEPPHPHFYTPIGGLKAADHQRELERRTRLELQSWLEHESVAPHQARCHVAVGRPASRIVEFAAQHGSDLLVLSTHGLSALERLLMGSTAEEVVRTAPCPVFTVKPLGKSLVADAA